MGTIKRLNDQQKQQAQAEAAMPGAYENRYDEGIQNALAGMDSANSAGLGYDSQNGTYRGALSRLFGNAGAGASAAEEVANGLSAGYGANWAKSAAQQAAAGETGQTANVYAQARADALSQWQQELAGQGTQLNNLLNQDQLARGEYDGSVADAANWRNYRYGRTQQARQENSDFLSNVWNVIKNVGSDVGKAYDAYMGYSQQKANAITQAKEEYRNGNVDGAKAILRMYRMDENMFDNLQGVSDLTVQQNAALLEGFNMLQQGAPEEMDHTVSAALRAELRCAQELVRPVADGQGQSGLPDQGGRHYGIGQRQTGADHCEGGGVWNGQHGQLQHHCKPGEPEQPELSERPAGTAEPVQDHDRDRKWETEQRYEPQHEERQREQQGGRVHPAAAEHDV